MDGFSQVIDEPLLEMFGRAVVVTEAYSFRGDMGVRSRNDGSRVRVVGSSLGTNVESECTSPSVALSGR